VLTVHDLQPDVQLKIQKVGIRKISVPVQFSLDSFLYGGFQSDVSVQSLLADASCYAELNQDQKGAHLSRFAEILRKWSPITLYEGLPLRLIQDLANRHESHCVYLKLRFVPLFEGIFTVTYQKKAEPFLVDDTFIRHPVNVSFPFQMIVPMIFEYSAYRDGKVKFFVTFELIGFNVCPCALKECDGLASHSQRALLRVSLDLSSVKASVITWDELFHGLINTTFAAPAGTVLKRDQELAVIQTGFQNPRFVEDSVRFAASYLTELLPGVPYSLVCDSDESIHYHNAVAVILNGMP
jgi:GTP cyclohydrolase I